jgi:hypothetical protein
MLAAKLFATLAVLHVGLALLESETHQSIDIYIHDTTRYRYLFCDAGISPTNCFAPRQRFLRTSLFRCFTLGVAPAQQFFRSHAFCSGDDWVCAALGVSLRAGVCSGNWLNGGSGNKSLDFSRGNARVAIFPVGLRDSCAELRIDRDQGISASQ